MARRFFSSDTPGQEGFEVRPSVWLQWYERNLRQVLAQWSKSKRCRREDLEILLFDRSDLENALEIAPGELTPAQKRKLERLDAELRKLMPAIKAMLPDIDLLREQLGVPESHWWWFPQSQGTKREGKGG